MPLTSLTLLTVGSELLIMGGVDEVIDLWFLATGLGNCACWRMSNLR